MCEEAAWERPLWCSLSRTFSVTQTEALPEKDWVFTELEPCIISSQGIPLWSFLGQERILLLLHQCFNTSLTKRKKYLNMLKYCALCSSGFSVWTILQHIYEPRVWLMRIITQQVVRKNTYKHPKKSGLDSKLRLPTWDNCW